MLTVSVGQSEDLDTRTAIRTAIRHCARKLKGSRPQAGLVFSGTDFDHRLLLAETLNQFPDIKLIGCTTGGEFSSDFGFSDDSVNLVMFQSDRIFIGAGHGRHLSLNPEAAIEAAVNQARRGLEGRPCFCLVFPDGLTGSPSAAIKALNDRLGPDCPVFGGVPSRQYEEERSTLQFFRSEILTDAVVLLLFSGDLRFAFSISNSWRPIGTRTTVTQASGQAVQRIGNMPALDFYRSYLGQHRFPAPEFPLAVYEDDHEHFFIRSPADYNDEDGSIVFSGPIGQGRMVQLTEATRNRILADTQNAITAVNMHLTPDWQPALTLAFSCATRKQLLGTRTPEELQILKQQLPADLPIFGFYCFGELAPLNYRRDSLLHNCTLVTVMIGTPLAAPQKSALAPPALHLTAPEGSTDVPVTELDHLRRENLFLQKKLRRSEYYRARLEVNKDLNDALLRKINREMQRAHLEIKRKNQLVRQSLALANEIQLNLLPQTIPPLEHFDIAARSIYCSETGGDYYDLIHLPEEKDPHLAVVVGDVTGHGIEAALLMTTARALLRSRAYQPGSLSQVIGDVNWHLTRDLHESGHFMTLYYLVLDPSRCRIQWVRAGHDPAIHYDIKTDTFTELRGPGLALGVDLNWHYQENEQQGLDGAQILFMGTDGIWETHNRKGNMFGKQPILDIIRSNARASADEIVNTVIDDLNRFRGNNEPEDDVTLIVIKCKNGHH